MRITDSRLIMLRLFAAHEGLFEILNHDLKKK